MPLLNRITLVLVLCLLGVGLAFADAGVKLTHGIDESSGGDSSYIITTPSATYYLDKSGGGLSSIQDNDGVDWLGFHKEPGSGWKGEYRGFPNAIHRQDGNYFHAMNKGTEPSSSVVNIDESQHVQIVFTSENKQWQAQWDFYADRCDFTMSKVSQGYQYWVQYEGVPGGSMNDTDFWYSSKDRDSHPIHEPSTGDLPAPEWMAFGDSDMPRMLYLLHHQDDQHPDNYVGRPYMTVFGFGRQDKDKFLDTVQTFSIGFVESTAYSELEKKVTEILN